MRLSHLYRSWHSSRLCSLPLSSSCSTHPPFVNSPFHLHLSDFLHSHLILPTRFSHLIFFLLRFILSLILPIISQSLLCFYLSSPLPVTYKWQYGPWPLLKAAAFDASDVIVSYTLILVLMFSVNMVSLWLPRQPDTKKRKKTAAVPAMSSCDFLLSITIRVWDIT